MKRIISRISNGIGNQMFLYAASFSLSKKLNRKLYLDIYTGLNSDINKNKKKKFKHFTPKFELKYFDISASILDKKDTFDSFFGYIKRKFLIFLDKFLTKKNFLIEHKNKKKITHYKAFPTNNNYKDTIFLEGYFESEKYFYKYRNELIKEFSLKNEVICNENYLKKIQKTESVSMTIRADRFNERKEDDSNKNKIKKSLDYEKKQIKFILRSMNYFNKKLKKPFFFIFSDNPSKFSQLFKKNKQVIFINKHKKNKVIEDYFLISKCKHFAVGPTSFHFWPAWLSEYKKKICIRPKDLNLSNNINYWPKKWVKI